mgnify:CR=1 FL=1
MPGRSLKMDAGNRTDIPLLVTTSYGGVFFGYGQAGSGGDTIRLERARMCVSWSADMHGVLGLAAYGPSMTCQVGPQVTAVTLSGLTAVVECSEVAAKRWENEVWGE